MNGGFGVQMKTAVLIACVKKTCFFCDIICINCSILFLFFQNADMASCTVLCQIICYCLSLYLQQSDKMGAPSLEINRMKQLAR